MSQEEQFWSRFLELAQLQLKDSAYDFFVADSKLVKIDGETATIYLDGNYKELFWETNLKNALITASFEVYNTDLKFHFVFEDTEEIPSSHSGENRRLSSGSLTTEPLPKIDTGLKSKYTFDNFVQGDGNIWAKAAALAVSENLATTYNPLFIYGGPGLGKTHLLNAIGNQILENIPNARVKYVPAETFINEFLEHLRLGEMKTFKNTYRSLDLLLIDDIQSLGDRSPDHLDSLEERLVTRFKWGLTQNITPPDFETRIAILRNKIEDLDYIFPNDTLEYLAGQFDSNVRDLEGALNDISLMAKVKKLKEITIDVAAEAIRARKNDNSKTLVIPIEKIQEAVGAFYGVSVKEIKGSRRVQNIVLARQVAMYLSREMTDNSLPRIGKEFGGKDHTTVIHAYEKIKSMVDTDDNLRLEIQSIKKKLN